MTNPLKFLPNWRHWLKTLIVGLAVMVYTGWVAFAEIPAHNARWLAFWLGMTLGMAAWISLAIKSADDAEARKEVGVLRELLESIGENQTEALNEMRPVFALLRQRSEISGSGSIQVPTPAMSGSGAVARPGAAASQSTAVGVGVALSLDDKIREAETEALKRLRKRLADISKLPPPDVS